MKNLLVILFIFHGLIAHAQYDPDYKKNLQSEEPESPISLGFGLGLDYGLFGARVSGFPLKHFGLFAGAGYNLYKLGYNLGGIGRILPGKKVCPYITGMYGINSVIVVVDADHYNEQYTGPTFGGGIELNFSNKRSFMNFGLLIPVRPQEFYDDWDVVKADPRIDVVSDPLPVGISVGYHLRFQ